ncbi:hypothetical protein JL720_13744 [Aureococcus anophagefferens]|nr:hypothetical protein JL720_13744 [Aureococcus anophagefferens]
MPVDYLEDARTAAGDGGVAGYAAPQAYHASNVFMADLWARDDKVRSAVGFNVLHKGAAAWPEKHAHPHGLLEAGENTLERLLLRVLLRLVATQQFYFGYEYVTDYAEFMTDPESHNDSWADEGHVKFFASFRSGAEKLEDNVADAIEVANAGILSHAGAMLVAHGRNLAARGMPDAELGALLADELRHHLGFDAAKLAKRGARYAEDPYADLAVLRDLGVGADVAEAVPAALYLAHRYAAVAALAPRSASANGGGAAAHRGALLGALLGAAHGHDALAAAEPALVGGLADRDGIFLDVGRFLDSTLAAEGSPGWLRAHRTRRPPGHRFHGLEMDCLDPDSTVP